VGEAGARGRFAGVVPSAGASERMGRPKGLLPVDGVSFLRRTVSALREGGCDPVLVIVAEGERELAEEAEAASARVLLNPDPGEGPITSLRLAIDELRGSVAGLAYLPVDHPLVRSETVRELLEAAREAHASLTLPTHGGERGHPALFGAALFDELTDPSLEGGARTVVHAHLAEALLVPVDDPGVLIDIDTPATYEFVLTTWEARR
jgi:molybdenum cofactor cytidylyltransferase